MKALAAFVALVTPAFAGPASPVVGTGQVQCYDDRAGIACPLPGQAYFGQDAQSQPLEPAYRDNGDGTVSDLRTGLEWVKSPGARVSWTQATGGAAGCRVGGHADWRLPTLRELYSLVLFSGTDVSSCMAPGAACPNAVPFLDTRYFDFAYGDTAVGERVIDAQYWSATSYVSTTMQGDATAFGVNFADGRIKGYPRDRASQFARYVRGPAYGASDLVAVGDGTVTDRATGLMWDAADSGTGMTWQQALAWVQAKNAERHRGHGDWRLPDAKELQSLVDYTRSPSTTASAAIDPRFQVTAIVDERGRTNYPFYWSSTTHADAAGAGGWAVYVAFGEALGWMQAPATGTWTLLDVHGAGAQRSDPKTGTASAFPHGHGPQGDVVRIHNHARLVRTVQ